MTQTIKIFATSKDDKKIEEVKGWLKVYRRSRKSNIQGISLLKRIKPSPENIAEYASVINCLLPNRRVTGFIFNRFLLTDEVNFKSEFPENSFNDEYYYLAFERVTWYMVPTSTIERKSTI